MIVFRPGTFETAPHTYIASVRAPRGDTRATLQRPSSTVIPTSR